MVAASKPREHGTTAPDYRRIGLSVPLQAWRLRSHSFRKNVMNSLRSLLPDCLQTAATYAHQLALIDDIHFGSWALGLELRPGAMFLIRCDVQGPTNNNLAVSPRRSGSWLIVKAAWESPFFSLLHIQEGTFNLCLSLAITTVHARSIIFSIYLPAGMLLTIAQVS